MTILCANRIHGFPPHIYHADLEAVRACCRGDGAEALDRDGEALLRRSGPVLGRSGRGWRDRVDRAWRSYVVQMDYWGGDVDVARAQKIKFYRRRWITMRHINLEDLW